MMNLRQALRLGRENRVALVGAGGKTTALFQLARLFDPPVVVTASTHLGEWQAALADVYIPVTRPEDVEKSTGQIEGVTLLTGPLSGDGVRLEGLDRESLQKINDLADQLGFPVFVEADGSRRKPLKAPGPHEPAIPDWVDGVVVVVGLSGLGKPLGEEWVHRPERFAELSGGIIGEPVTVDHLARLLAHPQGGLKNIPTGTRKTLLLNQVEGEERLDAAMRIAKNVNRDNSTWDQIIITSLEQHATHAVIEPVGGVILAAGQSSRFGQPKMLMPWRGKPILRHVAEAALEGGVNPLVVVSGAEEEGMQQACEGLPVVLVVNKEWETGQSSSMRKGLQALPDNTGAALFLLADQPFVSPALIKQIIERHQKILSPVIAPRVGEQRSNPVLFDRVTFPDLLTVQGDRGGRALFDRYEISYVDWDDANLLLDIDTPEDYRRLQDLEN